MLLKIKYFFNYKTRLKLQAQVERIFHLTVTTLTTEMLISNAMKYWVYILMVASSRFGLVDTQSDANFQTFTVSDETIEIDVCESAVIMPVSSHIQRVSNLGASVGDPCFTTQTFIDRCEARTNCEFINSEYRTEVEDSCASEVGTTEQLVFVYTCLPISDMKSIDGLNETVDFAYLRSPNYPENTEVSDVNEVCVMNPVRQDIFRLLELESIIFLTAISGTPELTLQSQVALQSQGPRHDNPNNNQLKQSINYTDFIGVDLESLNITYVQSAKNLKFLMKFNATSQVRICCAAVNETHPWQPCDPVIIPPLVTQRTTQGSSSKSEVEWYIWLVIALALVIVVAIAALGATIWFRRNKERCNCGASLDVCQSNCIQKNKQISKSASDSHTPDVIVNDEYLVPQCRHNDQKCSGKPQTSGGDSLIAAVISDSADYENVEQGKNISQPPQENDYYNIVNPTQTYEPLRAGFLSSQQTAIPHLYDSLN